jgi:hypothetical protein
MDIGGIGMIDVPWKCCKKILDPWCASGALIFGVSAFIHKWVCTKVCNILHDNHMISITYIPLKKNWSIYLNDLGGLMEVLYFIGYNKFVTNKTVIFDVIHTIRYIGAWPLLWVLHYITESGVQCLQTQAKYSALNIHKGSIIVIYLTSLL